MGPVQCKPYYIPTVPHYVLTISHYTSLKLITPHCTFLYPTLTLCTSLHPPVPPGQERKAVGWRCPVLAQ